MNRILDAYKEKKPLTKQEVEEHEVLVK